jgi:hypothetical protein
MKASPFMGITDAVKKISGWLDACPHDVNDCI